jgi:hypothetical protein
MATATMQRPFPFSFEATDLEAGDRMEVVLEFRSIAADEAQRGVREVLGAFAGLGAVGGLAGRALDPGRSGLTVEDGRVDAERSVWSFRDVHIDPAALFILANMLHYVHLEDVPLRLARVRWPGAAEFDGPSVVEFPEQWRNPSFGLEIGDLLDDIELDIEFVTPQDEATLAKVVDAMSAWLLATHRGAYADDAFDPAKTAVFLGPDVMSVAPERIVWYIEIMRCNESALDGLLNVLEWAHQNVAPISRVELGP